MKLANPKIHFNKNALAKFSKAKIAIILPYFNENLGLELFKNTKAELTKNHASTKNIRLIRVAGALEIPFAAKKISRQTDVIIALGVVIRGETSHYELVTETVYHGLMQVQLQTGIPIIFGILACENLKQARKRIEKNSLNKGKDAATAALIQINL